MGIGNWLGLGNQLARESTDYAAQIVQVRRALNGSAADAPHYCRLGSLYRQAGLPAKSQVAFRRSEALYQEALQRQPRDGAAIAGMSAVLTASGHSRAAETYLRHALQIAPNSAGVWLALGSMLSGRISRKTEPQTHAGRDAAAAYDRAVHLDPHNPKVWLARGGFRTFSLPMLNGKLVSPDGLSDYERAAALAPGDPFIQALMATMLSGVFEMQHGLYTSLEAAKAEPPDSNRRAQEAERRIAAVARSASGSRSASASMDLAWVQFEYFYDAAGAQRSLKLALVQDPDAQGAIDYQMHVAAVTGDYAFMAAVCRRELRRRPSLRLHILLAYADYYLAQSKPVYWTEGLKQSEIAHAAEPHEYAVSLNLAVFLLASGQAVQSSRADLLLGEIETQARLRPKAQQTEYDVIRGIGSALAGNNEDACRFLALALQNDPSNHAAKSALALLPAAVS